MAVNCINGTVCPAVTCRRSGPAFEWWTGYRWASGDTVPPHILAAQPPAERERLEAHRFRRMGGACKP
jgi:hypothetical protein